MVRSALVILTKSPEMDRKSRRKEGSKMALVESGRVQTVGLGGPMVLVSDKLLVAVKEKIDLPPVPPNDRIPRSIGTSNEGLVVDWRIVEIQPDRVKVNIYLRYCEYNSPLHFGAPPFGESWLEHGLRLRLLEIPTHPFRPGQKLVVWVSNQEEEREVRGLLAEFCRNLASQLCPDRPWVRIHRGVGGKFVWNFSSKQACDDFKLFHCLPELRRLSDTVVEVPYPGITGHFSFLMDLEKATRLGYEIVVDSPEEGESEEEATK